jgi:beta-galactosidase
LRHDGSPRRPYYEIKQLTKELEKIGNELVQTTVEAPVALIYSYDQMWAFESHKQYKNFDHREHLLTYYRALLKLGLAADLVEATADLSKYSVVIAPSMSMVSDEIYENMSEFVKNGGCLIIGARSGMKTWSNTTIDSPWPGLLAEMCGMIVDEFEVLPDHYSNKISYKDKEYDVKVWLDMLETKTAETVATYREKFYAGRTAISKNQFGAGMVYYVGVMGNADLANDFLEDVARDRHLPVMQIPKGIYVSRRSSDTESYIFYININREPTAICLEKEGLDVINEHIVSGEVVINGLDVLIVKN